MNYIWKNGIKKVFTEICSLNKYTKRVIVSGFIIFLAIFAIGTFIVVYNHTRLNYDPYVEFIANTIIKSSFTILAEIIIGSIILDFIFQKQ